MKKKRGTEPQEPGRLHQNVLTFVSFESQRRRKNAGQEKKILEKIMAKYIK